MQYIYEHYKPLRNHYLIAECNGTRIYPCDVDWFAQVGADEGSKQWKTRKPLNCEEWAAKELGWLRLVG